MKVRFACPACDFPSALGLELPKDWQCSSCEHRQHVEKPSPGLPTCVICGNGELYKKKDFPHWLGMSLLVGACLLSVVTYGLYEKWLTWAILIGTAIFDGILYLCVGDAVVCYRCNAHYRGVGVSESHQPFELTTGERFRQERIRKEQLKSSK